MKNAVSQPDFKKNEDFISAFVRKIGGCARIENVTFYGFFLTDWFKMLVIKQSLRT
ncbi:hypothetical protein PSR59_02560 [Ligilactobacillus ruminis]|uniref:Uncharacterized protein n=1 Tax=Ligilactobacillus ruminis TaxID=1623 RepID=A0AAQ2XL28_9LACO|nr:hypothetical protein [Ligilactobacillus ruminis]WDC82534.1 hypothetical protein PSR59_02560 [Ligilactobacillus ruminis]